MWQPYTDETQGILDDFLESLRADEVVNPVFVKELQRMLADGKLDAPDRIRQAIAQLEVGEDEFQD